MKNCRTVLLLCVLFPVVLPAQHMHNDTMHHPTIIEVEPQPLLAQALRLNEALTFLGSPLSPGDAKKLKALADDKPGMGTVQAIQKILDPYCLAMVNINPEERVSVEKGPAAPRLIQGGWTSFLVKVNNQAGITASLQVQSDNAKPLLHGSAGNKEPMPGNFLTPGQLASRFIEVAMYQNRPLSANLSGLAFEYAVVQVYSKEKGTREIELGFHVGQGSQDIGFRNSIHLLCNIRPSVKVKLLVTDDDGSPAMASFIITDGRERLLNDTVKNRMHVDYHYALAEEEFGVISKQLRGIYPLPSRRLAETDEYPDFFFQPQVYRSSGESVELPPGNYTVTFTRGPEYITQKKSLVVAEGIDSMEVPFQLKRWIDMVKLGWYSGDHHVHAAGCSHYESPQQGVKPLDMFRQIKG